MINTVVFDVNTKEIIGFSYVPIDPLVTTQKVKKLLEETDLYREFVAMKKKSVHKMAELHAIFQMSIQHKINKDLKMFAALENKLKEEAVKLDSLNKEIQKKGFDVNKLNSKIRLENAVYFETRPGEERIEKEEYEELQGKLKSLKKNKKLLRDGSIINERTEEGKTEEGVGDE